MALINCPECGKEISNKVEKCIHCGYPLSLDDRFGKLPLEYNEPCPKCNSINWDNICKDTGRVLCNTCFKLISLSPEREQAYFAKKKAIEEEQKQIKRQQEANKPKCPRCGSTEIQIVRKNWSIWSGFRTNDTERVCVKCKRKW